MPPGAAALDRLGAPERGRGGGWRLHGRGTARSRGRGAGWDFVHVAVDDRSRVAYSEVLPDEKGLTCAGFLYRAAKGFHDEHDVTIRRVLTDNAKNYLTPRDWITVCNALRIKRRYIKPHCPWTNGKAERFNRTLLPEWAYSRSWTYNRASATISKQCCRPEPPLTRRRHPFGADRSATPMSFVRSGRPPPAGSVTASRGSQRGQLGQQRDAAYQVRSQHPVVGTGA
jgi:transposase InsO family protein